MKLYPLNILKKTIRTKVLIKAMGARRDGGYCLLLKAILEEYGFKVFISCTRNMDFALKYKLEIKTVVKPIDENKDFEGIAVDQNIDKLKKFDNVILTPHIAGWSKESKVKLAQITVNKIKEFLDL